MKVVLHRDIKPSNVLLDDDMNGRLGDFGLARLYDHGADPQTTHVVGTIGYLAPELARTSKATPLTDVFSFGIFVLEVICGRKPIEQTAQDSQLMLVDWVLDFWRKGSLEGSVDIKLRGDYDVDEACLILKLGLLCSHPFTSARPTMRQVLNYLNGNMPLPDQLKPADMSFSMLSLMHTTGDTFSPVGPAHSPRLHVSRQRHKTIPHVTCIPSGKVSPAVTGARRQPIQMIFAGYRSCWPTEQREEQIERAGF